jgi:hypothetical protein
MTVSTLDGRAARAVKQRTTTASILGDRAAVVAQRIPALLQELATTILGPMRIGQASAGAVAAGPAPETSRNKIQAHPAVGSATTIPDRTLIAQDLAAAIATETKAKAILARELATMIQDPMPIVLALGVETRAATTTTAARPKTILAQALATTIPDPMPIVPALGAETRAATTTTTGARPKTIRGARRALATRILDRTLTPADLAGAAANPMIAAAMAAMRTRDRLSIGLMTISANGRGSTITTLVPTPMCAGMDAVPARTEANPMQALGPA